MGRAVFLPASVADCLEEALGESVRHVRIFEHSLFARLHIRAVATTRPRRIYLRGSGADFFENTWLMLHEYWHVLKQWESGDLTTPRYLVECLRHGYWNNRFEVEARKFADAQLARTLARLRAARKGAQALSASTLSACAGQAAAVCAASTERAAHPSAEQRLPVIETACNPNEQGTERERHANR
jgi:hypothetical protein